MKKFCILLILFSFISVMPSFALKVIVNESTDRKVPSRCSGPNETYVEDYDQQMSENTYDEYSQQEYVEKNNVNNNEKYELVYKQLLGENIRSELAGTRWNYPVNNYTPDENVEEQTTDKNINSNQEGQEVVVKRYLREAADYYFIDTIGSPNDVIPAGFEVYSQQ